MTETIDFAGSAPTAGSLDVQWIHGSRRRSASTDPAIQVHRYDEHTVILRQSKAVHYEAPFLFLLFGNDRALLLDTGATADPAAFPLRSTVDGLIADWLAEHPRESYGLVVAHTHGHGDHKAGDPQFAGRPDTTLVDPGADAVQEFFGFTVWPTEVVTFDLGGRVLEITGIPGHQDASIAVYDPWTGLLLTGDTVCPGRLYAFDYPAFVDSLHRLVDFARARRVTHVLGCHIEMTRRPRRDFPLGATYQPGERPLQLTVGQLVEIRDAADAVAGRPGVHRFDDFLIFNGKCRSALPRYAARLVWSKLTTRLRH
jgi:hydroxyacylglutathione hydrolase